MNRLEYTNDFEEVIRSFMDSRLSNLWTALPAIVQSYDPTTCTCVAQPAIKIRWSPDGADAPQDITIPVLYDLPVIWQGGGGFISSFPLSRGDSVLAIFASRCIDEWFINGGIQPQGVYRVHDLSDGFALPLCFARPDVPQNLPKDVAEIRSMDGARTIRLSSSDIQIVTKQGATIAVSDSEVKLSLGSTALKVSSSGVEVTGNLQVSGDVSAGSTSLKHHTHEAGLLLIAPPSGGKVTGTTGGPAT